MRTATPIGVLGLVLVLLARCATTPELEPMDEAKGAVGNTITKRMQDIEITVEVDTWPGWPEVKAHVTPLQVTIDNDGDRPIRVAYASFALSTTRGERFEVVPPLDVRGQITKPTVIDAYDTYWKRTEVPLPTPKMLEVALREGVLEPGGIVRGFLYFDKVDDEISRLSLTVKLAAAESGETLVDVTMPFAVE
jgi:hypothetical protein